MGRHRFGIVMLAVAAVACGCEPSGPPYPTDPYPTAVGRPTTAAARAGREAGVLQPGDWVEITVSDLSGPNARSTAARRVAGDGTVGVPESIGGRARVAGLTSAGAEAAVADAYRRADLAYNAVVTVRRVRLARADERTDGVIGRFDLVRVDVGGLTSDGATKAVTPDSVAVVRRVESVGTFDVPMVGRVKLAGLTEPAAAAAVADAFRQVLNGERVQATVTLLEPAPAGADRMDLPDEPLYPVPPALASVFYPQETPQPATPPAAAPAALVVPPSRPTTQPGIYQNGDTLEVTVADLGGQGKPLTATKRIGFDGTLPVPLIDPVRVAGLTNARAESAVADGYRRAKVLSNPLVSIRRTAIAEAGDPAVGPIHRYDLIRVTVTDLGAGGTEAANVTRRVDAAGEFAVPAVGPVKVEGLGEGQAAAAIADRYSKAGVIAGPLVDVSIVEAAPADADRRDLPDVPMNAGRGGVKPTPKR